MPNDAKLRLRSSSAPPSRRKALAKRAARLAKHVAAVWVDARSLSLHVEDPRLQTGEASLRSFVQDLLDVGAELDASGDDHPLFAFDEPAVEPETPSAAEPAAIEVGLKLFKFEAPGVEPWFIRARTIVDADRFLRAMDLGTRAEGASLTPSSESSKTCLAAEAVYEDTDYTAKREAVFLPREGTGTETPFDRERIAKIKDWRARQARTPVPDISPEWGRWSEFWVYLAVPGVRGEVPINVIHNGETGERFGAWHIEFQGPVSPTGYHSHFLCDFEVERAKEIGIVQYSLEMATRLNAEERGKNDGSKPQKKPKANRPGPIQEPIGPPPETIRPEPSWEVGSRWQIEVKFAPDGFTVFDFEVEDDFGGGDDYRRVKVGRPGSLGFDPSIKEEIVKPAEVAGPREWSIDRAERMTKDQLAANEQAVRRAETESKRLEDEPRWGRPQAFDVSIQVGIGSFAILRCELREEDSEKGVWIVWPLSMREAEYYERAEAETRVTPRAMIESIACARYKVAPSGPPGFQWGKPDRFIHRTAIDGKAATFKVQVEPNEREGAWIVTIAPPEWLDESTHVFDVDEHTAESCVVDDFASDQIEAIVKAWREERSRPKKLVDMTDDELTEAIDKSRANLAAERTCRPPGERPLKPLPSTWEDLPVTALRDAPGKPKLTERQANALNIKGIRTLGELQARLWEIPDLDGFRAQDHPRLRGMLDRWLDQHVRAKLDDGSAVDEELSHAILDRPESQARWRELLRRGCDDKQLKQAIADVFASGIGSSYGKLGRVDHRAKGGKTPEFRWGPSHLGIVPLKGQALVDRVRRLLSLPFPAEAEPVRKSLPGQTTFLAPLLSEMQAGGVEVDDRPARR